VTGVFVGDPFLEFLSRHLPPQWPNDFVRCCCEFAISIVRYQQFRVFEVLQKPSQPLFTSFRIFFRDRAVSQILPGLFCHFRGRLPIKVISSWAHQRKLFTCLSRGVERQSKRLLCLQQIILRSPHADDLEIHTPCRIVCRSSSLNPFTQHQMVRLLDHLGHG
jgi:hypothetical protein